MSARKPSTDERILALCAALRSPATGDDLRVEIAQVGAKTCVSVVDSAGELIRLCGKFVTTRKGATAGAASASLLRALRELAKDTAKSERVAAARHRLAAERLTEAGERCDATADAIESALKGDAR